MRAWVAIISLVVAGSTSLPNAQRQQASPSPFHAEIDYVEFPVRVMDAHGNFIRDLPQSAFQIFEDGQPQTINTFKIVEVTASDTSGHPSAQTAVVTNAAELAQTTGRIYLFVFDTYHILPAEVPRAKEIVARFIRTRLTDDDRAAIVFTSGGGQDFTGNREALLSAVDRAQGRLQSVKPSQPRVNRPAQGETLEEAQIHARATLKAISDASTWLGDAHGRRTIVILVSDDIGCAPGADRVSPCGLLLEDTVKSTRQADVSIYPLHIVGLDVPDCLKAQHAGGLTNCGSVSRRARGPLSALSVLATETGGFMIKDTNNFDSAFDRVLRENSFHYLVGYYSTNANHNGKFRKNEIALARKDLHALYRPGYMAPARPHP